MLNLFRFYHGSRFPTHSEKTKFLKFSYVSTFGHRHRDARTLLPSITKENTWDQRIIERLPFTIFGHLRKLKRPDDNIWFSSIHLLFQFAVFEHNVGFLEVVKTNKNQRTTKATKDVGSGTTEEG
jgi:hypothetical protein